MKKIRLGILGVGNMGCEHFENIMEKGLCPEIEVTAIADNDPKRLEAQCRSKKPWPDGVTKFENAEALMDSGLIDAVLISVPHYFHPGYAIAAMRKGLHVMLEKPAGVYTKAVREMNAVAAQAGVVFGMMFNQRTDCVYRKMREIVRGGEMGEIRRTNWVITDWYRSQEYYDSGAWRATWSGEGGGVLLNQAPHNLDLWQWICGMPVKVKASSYEGKWHNIEVEDDVTAFVEYPNGATGVFISTTGDNPGTNRFEITLEKGKLVAENRQLKMWRFDEKMVENSKGLPPSVSQVLKEEIVETDGLSPQHAGVLNAFAGALLRGEPLVAGGEEGIHSLTLSNAIYLAGWTGETISLPLDEERFHQELKKRILQSKGRVNYAMECSVID